MAGRGARSRASRPTDRNACGPVTWHLAPSLGAAGLFDAARVAVLERGDLGVGQEQRRRAVSFADEVILRGLPAEVASLTGGEVLHFGAPAVDDLGLVGGRDR